MNEPRVYKQPVFVQVLLLVLFAVVFFGVFFGVGMQASLLVLPLGLLFGALFLFIIFSQTSKTIISEEEISTQNLLGTKTLRWVDVHHVSGRGHSINLHNFDGDVIVSPSSRLPKYEEVIEWIGRKRPDLFSTQDYAVMKRGVGSILASLFAFVVLLGAGAAFFWSQMGTDITPDSLVPMIFFVIVFFAIISMMFTSPLTVTLEGGNLYLKYALREVALMANEIASVHYSYTQTRNGKHYFIALHLTTGKTLRLSSLNIGLPIAYLTIKNWHAKNT